MGPTVTVNQAPTCFDIGFAVGKETFSCHSQITSHRRLSETSPQHGRGCWNLPATSRGVKSDCVGWEAHSALLLLSLIQPWQQKPLQTGPLRPRDAAGGAAGQGPALGEGPGSRATAGFCWVWATQNTNWTSATKAKAVLQHCFRNRAANSSYVGLSRQTPVSSAHRLLYESKGRRPWRRGQLQDRTTWKQAQTVDFGFWNRDSDSAPLLPCSFQLPASLEGVNAREKMDPNPVFYKDNAEISMSWLTKLPIEPDTGKYQVSSPNRRLIWKRNFI